MVRHNDGFCVFVSRESCGNTLLELLCAGQTVGGEQNTVPDNLTSLCRERRYTVRGGTDDGGKLLMGVDDKARFGMRLVNLGVNALFGGGLDIAAVRKSVYLDLDDIVRCQAVIRLAARSDDKAFVIDTAAYVSPGSGDKSGCNKLFAGCDNLFFCSQNIHLNHPFKMRICIYEVKPIFVLRFNYITLLLNVNI